MKSYQLIRRISALVGILALFLGGVSCFALGNAVSLPTSLEEGTVVLAYFVSDEATSVSVITYAGVQTTSRIAITQRALAEQVLSFMKEIESPPMTGQEAVSYLSALEKGHDLYDLLVAPVEKYLQGATHLVIVPSDVLFLLPFEALVNCPGCGKRDLYGGKFLVETYPISYASSLSSLELSLQDTGTKKASSILAVGNPLGYSPHSEREVRYIATLFPEATVLIGANATIEAIEHLLKVKSFDVVHLAAGCLSLDAQAPLLSGIRLFPGGDDEDGIFRVDELLGLGVSINLLTFSTGLTMQSPVTDSSEGNRIADSTGKAFRNFVGGILASGVASTVIPLGNVGIQSTEKLMEVMYQELMQGITKDEALREAQLSLLRDHYYHHPYYWASFVLYGDWSGMSSKRPPDTGKLDYALYQKLQEWKTSKHAPDEIPPLVSVVVTLAHPATQKDLDALEVLSDKIEVQGAFGSFVQLRLPLTLLDAVCALPEVRSVATPAGTISN